MKFFAQALMAAAIVCSSTHLLASDVAPEISLEEFKKVVDAKTATIIDVNSEKSYKKAHVPGAIHYGTNKKTLAEKLPQDKSQLIVAYCGGPMCSAWEDAAKDVQKLGYTNVKHYKGGIKGWTKAKMPTEGTKKS